MRAVKSDAEGTGTMDDILRMSDTAAMSVSLCAGTTWRCTSPSNRTCPASQWFCTGERGSFIHSKKVVSREELQ
jgi:hypothetical protein